MKQDDGRAADMTDTTRHQSWQSTSPPSPTRSCWIHPCSNCQRLDNLHASVSNVVSFPWTFCIYKAKIDSDVPLSPLTFNVVSVVWYCDVRISMPFVIWIFVDQFRIDKSKHAYIFSCRHDQALFSFASAIARYIYWQHLKLLPILKRYQIRLFFHFY